MHVFFEQSDKSLKQPRLARYLGVALVNDTVAHHWAVFPGVLNVCVCHLHLPVGVQMLAHMQLRGAHDHALCMLPLHGAFAYDDSMHKFHSCFFPFPKSGMYAHQQDLTRDPVLAAFKLFCKPEGSQGIAANGAQPAQTWLGSLCCP